MLICVLGLEEIKDLDFFINYQKHKKSASLRLGFELLLEGIIRALMLLSVEFTYGRVVS